MGDGSTPSVTVIMPARNVARFVEEAIRSVLAQTLTDLELIVIDDGSTDGTAALVAECAASDTRVVLRHQASAGSPAARNNGIAVARGRYIALLDSDDIAVPTRLQQQRDFLDAHPSVAAVGGALELINDDGRVFDVVQYPITDGDIRAGLPQIHPMAHTAAMVRREAFEEIRGYRRAFVAAQDLDLWLRIAERHDLANLPDVVCRYRIHPSQTTVVELEQQALGKLAAHAAARARAATQVDPFDSVDHIDEELLHELGVTADEICEERVRRACGVAGLMAAAGYGEEAEQLAQSAMGLARSPHGSPHLVAIAHRSRAERLRRSHHTLRANLELARATVADRATVHPLVVITRLFRSGARRQQ